MSGGVSGWLHGRLEREERVNDHARILFLRVPGWPGNLPGQHLDLRLTAEDGYQAARSYSLASYGESDLVEIAVDELPDGEVSPYLVEDMMVGDELEIRGPLGAYFVWTPAQTEPVQLIAGGSGIVPLVSIARAHAASESSAPMRLLYSVRGPADAFYAQELAQLANSNFALDWVYTRTVPAGWPRPAGRLDAATAAASVISSADDPLVYICGPTGFVEATTRLLQVAGFDDGRIKTERFGGT
ncbi:ferredoxin-NADP reductase [Microbacterium endophyticum]|uniref:Ferredoxin-NADP reductase n=1 Tax=Microbacterium endophyticum TaxID=1526412 RepID=A0A7W4YN34_9MICO|nr:ferredoxin reductase [Microbacterium endophyticum]MBB2975296.1 ferredoxin-NADP reductase [Microbacterium endophyticum]NIK35685.1 ferredoxin-NADP reductase [Microbacterium endophyticum]